MRPTNTGKYGEFIACRIESRNPFKGSGAAGVNLWPIPEPQASFDVKVTTAAEKAEMTAAADTGEATDNDGAATDGVQPEG